MPKRDGRYFTDDTCAECRKADPKGAGLVGCWRVGNSGTSYQVHPIYHACCQFYPKCGWKAYGHNKEKGQK